MEVTVKLFAILGKYLPPHAIHNTVRMDITAGTSVAQLLRHLHLPLELTPVVLVNGDYIPPSEHAYTPLNYGDELAVFPPVSGG
ncbi:MAG: MoaD/ThiS family protein [Candidatus Tectimicrobiota bacterium]